MAEEDDIVKKFEETGPKNRENPRIKAYRENDDNTEMPTMEENKIVDDENIVVNITSYAGDDIAYNNWTIQAEAWLERGDGPEKKNRMRVGISKKTGSLTEEEVVKKVKDKYRDLLKEDESYGDGKPQEISESEKVLENLRNGDAKK